MKKIILFLLVLSLSVGFFAGCGATPVETVSTTAATTTAATEEPDVYVSSTIIQNGASDYVIVHDGKSESNQVATDVKNAIMQAYGVNLPIKTASTQEPGGCEIVIGTCRDRGVALDKKLRSDLDFGMKVAQDQLVLCAKDTVSYQYLVQYLKKEVFIADEKKELVLTSDDNMIYSASELMDTNYIDYITEDSGFFAFKKVFNAKLFENENTQLPYQLYVPFNYSADKSYPLILNLHGAGLRGVDNQRQLNFLDTMMKDPSLELDEAIIVMPQCPEDGAWVDTNWNNGSYSIDTVTESPEMAAVIQLIGQLQEIYPVDSSRIYSVGFSMGGYGTWDILMRHSDLFCAGIPMCGAGDPSQAETLAQIPIWAVHGAKDPTVPVTGSRDMVEAIQAVGGDKIRYTELPDAVHDVWNYTYSNTEIFTWLLSQKKG